MRIISTIFFILIIVINAKDFGYYYDSSQEKIYLDIFTNQSFLENNLLNSKTLRKHYYSSAGNNNQLEIGYYSCDLTSSLNMTLDLIKVTYNLTEHENVMIKEVILDMDKITGNTFPQKYSDEFTVTQNKEASLKGKKKRDSLIYDTFGFNVKSKNNLNFKISKILLVNFRKNKLNYLANLSYNIRQYYSNTTFDIYLRDLPQKFDLYITLDLCDENWKEKGEKVLIVKKDFNYPNFRIEELNPNKTMLIISITFVLIAFVLTILFVLLKFIFDSF